VILVYSSPFGFAVICGQYVFHVKKRRLTLGFPVLDMFSENTCLYFFSLVLSAVSTTAGQPLVALVKRALRTELGRVDIGQLGSVSVSSSRQLLLVVVIVTRSETDLSALLQTPRLPNIQVSEDELRDHNPLFLMHLNRDTSPIVEHRYLLLLSVDGDLQRVHRGIVDLLVSSIPMS